MRRAVTHDNARRPRVEEEEGADEECAGQHHADGEQEPVAEAHVLLPEQEGVAVGVGGQPLAAVVAADGALLSLFLWKPRLLQLDRKSVV